MDLCDFDARLRNVDPANGLSAVANLALELLLDLVCIGDEAASLTDVHRVAVADFDETLLQEASSAVRYHAVTLHLSESEAAVSRSTFSGLSSQDLNRASASRVHLVIDHVLQPLVEGRS